MDESKTTIYVLKLEDGFYYVGKTKNPQSRFRDHFDKSKYSSVWIQHHPVVEIAETFEGDDFDEDKYVKIYMQKYGIDKVRGGSYSRLCLTKEEKIFLERELNGSSNKCFRCGRTGHFINACYATKHLDGSFIKKEEPLENPSTPVPPVEENKIEDDIADFVKKAGSFLRSLW